jgi:protein ImuB
MPDLMAERRFADPIASRDVIAGTLLSLAQSLCGLLEREGRGARLLQAAFFRADGKVERLAVRAGAPLRDPAIMLRLLNQKLDALADPLDPGFGFDLIRLEALLAQDTRPLTVSFDANENARRQVDFLIDRLAARLGGHRVLRFVAQDTHVPEAAAVAIPAQDRDTFDSAAWPVKRRAADPPLRPLRLLERAEEISHVMASVPDGPPGRFRWRQCLHQVARAEGPERIAMEWWRSGVSGNAKTAKTLTRDYFRVETREGLRLWLYRDGLYRETGPAARWYLQGIFA